MFTELKLSNFRMFDDEVSVRFRPITVLIGRNSSGKSTILKFLLMLKQSSASTSDDFPVLNGHLVRLGSFLDLKSKLSSRDSLDFELSFEPTDFDSLTLIAEALESGGDIQTGSVLVSLRGTVPYTSNPQEGKTTYLAREKDSPDPFFDHTVDVRNDDIFYVNALRNRVKRTRRLFQDFINSFENSSIIIDDERFSSLDREFITDSIGFEFQNVLRSVHHLPPIRGELGRLIDISDATKESNQEERENTLLELRKVELSDPQTSAFLSSHLRNVAGMDSISFEDDPQDKSRAFARNIDTGAKVLIADFGFGVSQCLPVLVKGATIPSDSCLMVEQPEAHLHPTSQLHLGSFFADLWTNRGVKSIIETHSQNVLLRIRRLIANQSLDYRDVSVAFFTFDEEKEGVPIVKNLDINEDGSMQPGLPMEFFAADIREGLMLGLGK